MLIHLVEFTHTLLEKDGGEPPTGVVTNIKIFITHIVQGCQCVNVMLHFNLLRLVLSILGLGSMGSVCYSKINGLIAVHALPLVMHHGMDLCREDNA